MSDQFADAEGEEVIENGSHQVELEKEYTLSDSCEEDDDDDCAELEWDWGDERG